MSRYEGKHRAGNTEKVIYHTGGPVHAAVTLAAAGCVVWPVIVTVDSAARLEWVDRAVERADAVRHG
jgi:hypothetical protein